MGLNNYFENELNKTLIRYNLTSVNSVCLSYTDNYFLGYLCKRYCLETYKNVI